MKRKKILSVFLSIVIVLISVSVSFHAFAGTDSDGINKLLYEKMLRNKPWIIDTLIRDDHRANPYAIAGLSETTPSVSADVMNNFSNNRAFGTLVLSYGFGEDAKDYLLAGLETLTVTELNLLGIMSDEDLLNYVDNYIKNGSELRYESVLDAVLTSDYTSSWGTTLLEESADLGHLSEIKTDIKLISSIAKTYKVISSDYKVLSDYTNSYDKLDGMLDNSYDLIIDKLKDDGVTIDEDDVENLKWMQNAVELLIYLPLMAAGPKELFKETDVEKIDIFSKVGDKWTDNIKDIFSAAGKTLDFTSDYLSKVSAMIQMLYFGERITGVLGRMQGHTDREDMITVLGSYRRQYEKTVNNSLLSSLDLLRQQIGSSTVISSVTDLLDKVIKKEQFNYNGSASISVAADQVSEALAIVKLASWLSNKLTGIEDCAKAVYICLYVNEMIAAAVGAFNEDHAAFLSSRTDENASKCINDLEFIKMLRLFSEKTAYGALKDQATSLIGTLMGGSIAADSLKKRYEQSVDRLIGCSFTDASPAEITVSSGQKLTAIPTETNGAQYWTLTMTENGARKYSIPYFADALCDTSLRIRGGEFDVYGTGGKNHAIMFRTVELSSGLISLGNAALLTEAMGNENGSVRFTGSAQLTVNAKLENIDKFNVAAAGAGDTAQCIRCYDFINNGTVNLNNVRAEINGSLKNTGYINGGEIVVFSDKSWRKDDIMPDVEPEISGMGYISSLRLLSAYDEGINVTGTQRISDFFSGSDVRMKNSETILLTGNCHIADDVIRCPIGLENFTLTQPLTFISDVYVHGNTVLQSRAEVDGTLYMCSDCNLLDVQNGLDVYGGFRQYKGSLNGSDKINLYGDVYLTTPDLFGDTLKLIGHNSQFVSASQNIRTKNLVLRNTSRSGVTVNCPVSVSEKLDYADGTLVRQGENVTLTADGTVINSTINGNVTFDGVELTKDLTVNGILYCKNSVRIADGVTLCVNDLITNSGSLDIGSGGALICTGDYQGGSMNNSGSVSVGGNASFTGKANNTGSTAVQGDLSAGDGFTGGSLTVSGDVYSSSAINVDILELNGRSPQNFSAGRSEVGTFVISNTSRSGASIGSPVSVTGILSAAHPDRLNMRNITLPGDAVTITDGEYDGDLRITGNYSVPAGEKIRIKGSVTLESGSLTLGENAEFTADGSFTSANSAIGIAENAKLSVNDYLYSASDKICTDGTLYIKGDASISSTTLQGTGSEIFCGDLYSQWADFGRTGLEFSAKIPQTVSVSDMTAGDITLANSSRSGILLTGKITYYGELTGSPSTVTGTLIKGQ